MAVLLAMSTLKETLLPRLLSQALLCYSLHHFTWATHHSEAWPTFLCITDKVKLAALVSL